MTDREAWESSIPVRALRGLEGPAITLLKMVGPDSIKGQLAEIDKLRESGMKKRGNEGFDWAGLVGSLVPGGAIAKGVTGALPAAASLAGKMGTGATVGAVTSAAQPLPNGQDELSIDKLKQVGSGAVVGGAIPAVVQAAQAVKAAGEPFYQKGREAIIGRTLNTAAGGQQPQAIHALSTAKELVPGSRPTVAQASQNAGLASLERAATSTSPEATVSAQIRGSDQNAARAAALETVAGTPQGMADAVRARKLGTAGLIQQVNQSAAQVDPSRTISLIDNIINKAPGRTQLTAALENVKKSLVDANGAPRENVSQLYQGARKNVTDLLAAKAGDGSKLNEAISRELSVVLKSLDHQINKADPAYGQFLKRYTDLSKPINQMQIGQEVAGKATNATGDVQLNALVQAMTDKTAQKATGFKRATLAKVLTPDQLGTMNAVKNDLVRAVQARNIAGSAGSDTVKKLAYTNLIDRAGVPTFLREFAPTQMAGNFMARGADAVYGRANNEIASQLAQTLMNPQEAARLMQQVGPSKYAAIIDAMTQQASGAAGTTVGRNQ